MDIQSLRSSRGILCGRLLLHLVHHHLLHLTHHLSHLRHLRHHLIRQGAGRHLWLCRRRGRCRSCRSWRWLRGWDRCRRWLHGWGRSRCWRLLFDRIARQQCLDLFLAHHMVRRFLRCRFRRRSVPRIPARQQRFDLLLAHHAVRRFFRCRFRCHRRGLICRSFILCRRLVCRRRGVHIRRFPREESRHEFFRQIRGHQVDELTLHRVPDTQHELHADHHVLICKVLFLK